MNAFEPSRHPKARVAICIPTYRRAELLRQLLSGIAALTFRRMPAPDLLIVVVDNDPSRSAADICNTAALPWRVKYVVETRRGIAQARNRAIEEAEDPDFYAFIDDDEVPTPQWLDELLWIRACFESDVVCGPVLPRYASGVPEWVKSGGFFSREVYTNGDLLQTCRTGNVLVSRKVFAAIRSFDERFALTGGEDTHFFLRVRRAGFEIVGSGSGVVYETVPTSRATLRWLLRRAYQSGNSWVLCETSLDARASTRAVRVAKATARILQGALSACTSPVLGKAALAQALFNLFLGAGMMAALAGRNFQAYESAGTDASK